MPPAGSTTVEPRRRDSAAEPQAIPGRYASRKAPGRALRGAHASCSAPGRPKACAVTRPSRGALDGALAPATDGRWLAEEVVRRRGVRHGRASPPRRRDRGQRSRIRRRERRAAERRRDRRLPGARGRDMFGTPFGATAAGPETAHAPTSPSRRPTATPAPRRHAGWAQRRRQRARWTARGCGRPRRGLPGSAPKNSIAKRASAAGSGRLRAALLSGSRRWDSLRLTCRYRRSHGTCRPRRRRARRAASSVSTASEQYSEIRYEAIACG